MKKCLTLLLTIVLLIVMVGCTQTRHKVEFADEYPITNKINESYATGEEVEIVLDTITEHYYVVTVNGEEIAMNEGKTDMVKTTFTFTMPDNDVMIEIEQKAVKMPVYPTQDTEPSDSTEPSDTNYPIGEVQLHPLYKQYPEYWDLDGMKGVEVYMWLEEDNSYRCGALIGTNRMKANDEIEVLFDNGATIEEMRAIFELCGIGKDRVSVIIISNPIESDWYKIEVEEIATAMTIFWGDNIE